MASTLIIVVVGFNFILIFNEVKEHKKRKAIMKQLSSTVGNGKPKDKKTD
ncbi:MAG: hypothetical protein A4E38_00123 [Methanoregulaceae archaeon PtaB.Bin108]|nr:MAG: hypothetical protein A4E38_00123 [Methanoregulaceae archaeon PtaB.Bin108]